MSKPLTSVPECEWEQEQLDSRIRAFLRSRGWAYTCEYASIWLFTKEVEGAAIVCPQDTALVIEEWEMNSYGQPAIGQNEDEEEE